MAPSHLSAHVAPSAVNTIMNTINYIHACIYANVHMYAPMHMYASMHMYIDSKTLKMLKYRIAKKSTNKISFHIHNNHFKQL